MRQSITVKTPNCGSVYIFASPTSNVLECFWRDEVNSRQRAFAGNWLSLEGWFQCANGQIELPDEGLFDRIQEETVT